MSAKNRDNKNRWRNITVGFRVSPEENELINRAVALSGLPKQEYCYRRCLNQDVVVQGNPRVYKALKTEFATVLAELKNQDTDFKGYEQSFEEMQREILRQLDPSYLKTVSMTTLYDTVFEVQTPLIDGLLQRGTYLFVGSPKVGKSFMMAQLAYHISTGTPLWEYKVPQTQA